MEVFHHRCWLGHGSYGDVQLCEVSAQTAAMLQGTDAKEADHVFGPVLIALKTWKQAHKELKVMRIALREVRILKLVSHPNIIKLLCAFRTPSGRVCMAFEYGGKSSRQLLDSKFPRGIPHAVLQRLTFQLVQGLRYLHAQRIVHRDVKPANILVDSAGVLRLCDFGFTRLLPAAPTDDVEEVATVHDAGGCGDPLTPYVITRWYRAPEVLLGMPYGTATDIWSLGCTIAELATGEPLLPGTSSLDQIARISDLLGPIPSRMVAAATPAPAWDGASIAESKRGNAMDVAAARTAVDALRRRLGSQVPQELLKFLAACLKMDPRERCTAVELLQMPYFAGMAHVFPGTSLGCMYEDRRQPPPPVLAAPCGQLRFQPQPLQEHSSHQHHDRHTCVLRRASHLPQQQQHNQHEGPTGCMHGSTTNDLSYSCNIFRSADASGVGSCNASCCGVSAGAATTAAVSRSNTNLTDNSSSSTTALQSSSCFLGGGWTRACGGGGSGPCCNTACECPARNAYHRSKSFVQDKITPPEAAAAVPLQNACGPSDDGALPTSTTACWHATAVPLCLLTKTHVEAALPEASAMRPPSPPSLYPAPSVPAWVVWRKRSLTGTQLQPPPLHACPATATVVQVQAPPAIPAVASWTSNGTPLLRYEETAVRALAAEAAFPTSGESGMSDVANVTATAAAVAAPQCSSIFGEGGAAKAKAPPKALFLVDEQVTWSLGQLPSSPQEEVGEQQKQQQEHEQHNVNRLGCRNLRELAVIDTTNAVAMPLVSCTAAHGSRDSLRCSDSSSSRSSDGNRRSDHVSAGLAVSRSAIARSTAMGCATVTASISKDDPWAVHYLRRPCCPVADALAFGNDGGIQRGDGSTAGLSKRAAVGCSAEWLDAYYHDYSPVIPSTLTAVTAVNTHTSAQLTTMRFNWHNAESPLDGGGSKGAGPIADVAPTLYNSKRAETSAMEADSPTLCRLLSRQPQQPPKPRPEQQQPRWRRHGVPQMYEQVLSIEEASDGGNDHQAIRSPSPPLPPPVQQKKVQLGALPIVSCELCMVAAVDVCALSELHERRRPRKHAGELCVPDLSTAATDTLTAASCDGYEGCRPEDANLALSVLQSRCVSSSVGRDPATAAESSASSIFAMALSLSKIWRASAWPPSASSAATVRWQPLGRMTPFGNSAFAAGVRSARQSFDIASLASARRKTVASGRRLSCADDARKPMSVATPQPAIRSVRAFKAFAAAAVAETAHGGLAAPGRPTNAGCSSASGMRICRASIEKRRSVAAAAADDVTSGAVAIADVATCGGALHACTGSRSHGGGGIRNWVRKSRVWLRARLHGSLPSFYPLHQWRRQ